MTLAQRTAAQHDLKNHTDPTYVKKLREKASNHGCTVVVWKIVGNNIVERREEL